MANPKKEMEEEFLEGHKHFSPRGRVRHCWKKMQTLAGWPFCLVESWAETQKSFSISFYFSKDVQKKNQCNLCGSIGVLYHTGTGEKVLQLMNQLTCSIKERTGNYFGTCKRKKGQGVKREENIYYWALSGEAKSIHSLPPRHCPLPTGDLNAKYRITISYFSPSHSDRLCAVTKTNPWERLQKYLALASLIWSKQVFQ